MGIATRTPLCIFQCCDDDTGRMDPYKYHQYLRTQRDALTQTDHLKMVAMCETIAKDEAKKQAKLYKPLKRKKVRHEPREERLIRVNTDGWIRQFGARDTDWFNRYVSNPPLENKQFMRKFRSRFRCGYDTFLKHLEELKSSELFKA